MSQYERLQQAIRDLHGLESQYERTETVHETFQGKMVWEGNVKVFRVRGHPQAQFAYAWTREDHDGTKHQVAVLGVPPIDSAQEAVQAALMAEGRKRFAP